MSGEEEQLERNIKSFLTEDDSRYSASTIAKIPVSELNEKILLTASRKNNVYQASGSENSNDSASQYGSYLAMGNLESGTSFSELIIMLKCCRRAYIELVDRNQKKFERNAEMSQFINNWFDHIELGVLEVCENLTTDNYKNHVNEKMNSAGRLQNHFYDIFQHLNLPLIIVDKNDRVLNYNLEASGIYPEIAKDYNFFELFSINDLIKTEFLRLYHDFINSDERNFEGEISRIKESARSTIKFKAKKISRADQAGEIILLELEDLGNNQTARSESYPSRMKTIEKDGLEQTFLASISHEIRTPMHAIVGFSELLLNGNYPYQERQEYLELIRQSSNDLLNMIEDIVDMSKMESRQIKINYKECHPFRMMNSLYPEYQEALRRAGKENEIQLILSVTRQDRAFHFFTDYERLRQVISNLMSNAIKFTTRGYIEYGFKQIRNDQILFFVRDSGPGIPDDQKIKVFDRFYQGGGHQNKFSRGTGLGLAICKHIIQLLGGSIWVESFTDEGSCFYFQIPLTEASLNDGKEVLSSNDVGHSYPDWNDKHILVAEDDEINFLYIQEILKRCGAKVKMAKNGIEAINIVEIEPQIDLVLMDIKMPEIDGLEAARCIRKISPGIPIIALTAFAMEGDRSMCLESGCIDYIAKPIEKVKLLKIMDRYIHQQHEKSLTSNMRNH